MAAADGQIKIRIGAVQDRSIETVFGGIEKRALRLRDSLGKALTLGGAKGGNQLERSFGAIERASKKAADGVDKTWNQELARLDKIAKAQDRIFERVERNKVREAERSARERARIEQRANREIERAFRQAARDADREANRQERTRRQFAERTSWRATRFMFPPPTGAIDVGRRVASDILRGAGVDFSLQSSIARGVSLQRGAVQLSNSAFIGGAKGLAGQRVDPAAIEAFIRSQAPQFGMSSNDTLEAMQTFVGRTGDYATAKASLPGLLRLGLATGTKPEDLMSFAGTVGATAFDSPAKDAKEAAARADFINKTVNVAAYSGKLGTTEISDLAKYGPKLAATAQAFGGDPSKNLGEMYALAQLGLKGGAANPAQATTSVAAMLNTLRTPARRKAFKAAGVELESQPGVFRSASDIAIDSIVAAGTDTAKFKSMWANVQGARPLEGLRSIFLKAGGGQAGKDALRQQFAQLGGSLSEAELAKSTAAAQGTTGFKAQAFQERWDAVFSKMAQDALPSLEKLAPTAITLAKTFADVVEFAAKAPVAFGALVFAATLLRAALESAARAALEQRLMGMPTGTPGVPGAGSGIGGMFTGGAGYSGIRGVINSPGVAMAAPIAAAVAVDLAHDQAAKFSQENGGMGVTDALWGAISDGSLFSKGVGGMFNVVDAKMNADAKAEAEARAKTATVSGGPGVEALKPMTPEEMTRALLDANARGIRVTNLGDIKLAPPPPTVDPNGRTP